jgi:uncharacterized protein (TIGR00730 family)
MNQIKSLCVFCGSQSGNDSIFAERTREIGKHLAEQDIQVVYGGGSVGLMGVLADSCLEAGGEVIGVITEKLLNKEVGHSGVTRLEVVDTMLDRKTRMAELSDSFVSLPGGVGTMDELFEMVTWGLLGLHGQTPKPNGILNVAGYYDSLIEFLQSDMVGRGFLKEKHASNLICSDDFPDLLEKMRQVDLVSKIDSGSA